jgi:hypothetical protein
LTPARARLGLAFVLFTSAAYRLAVVPRPGRAIAPTIYSQSIRWPAGHYADQFPEKKMKKIYIFSSILQK